MKRLFFFLIIITLCSHCLGQNQNSDNSDKELRKLNEYFETGKFEEASVFFEEHKNQFDPTTNDILSSVINIGLFSKDKNVNLESTVDCIKRVIKEFSSQKEDIRTMPKEMMVYFNIYIFFLGKINNPYYLDVYRLFKEIWPTISNENSTIYIYVLENVSTQTIEEQRYEEAIPVFEELIELDREGYQLSTESYINYCCLASCYQCIGKDNEAAKCYDHALISFSSKDKTEKHSTYLNIVRDRFEVACKLSQVSKCREMGKVLLDYYENRDIFIQDYIDISMKLAEIEFSAFKIKECISLYEKAGEHLLQSVNYDVEKRKTFLVNLNLFYNILNVEEDKRKFKDYTRKYHIDTANKKETVIIDEHYVDSLWTIVRKQKITKDFPKIKSYTNAITLLSQYYSNRGQELYGIQLLEKAIKSYQDNKIDEQEQAPLFNALGSVYYIIQNMDNAKENHGKALKIFKKNGIINADYIGILCNLADDHRQSGEPAIAKAFLDEAHEMSLSMDGLSNDKVIYYHLLQSYSYLYKSLNDVEKALTYNSKILDDISDKGDSDQIKTFQSERIQILLYFNRFKEAYKLMEEIGSDYFSQYDSWWTPFIVKYYCDDITCIDELEKMKRKDYDDFRRLYSSFSSSELENFWDITGGTLNVAFSMTLSKFNTPPLRTNTYNNLLFTKNYQLELSKYKRNHPGERLSKEQFDNIFKSISNTEIIRNSLKPDEVAIEYFVINKRINYKEFENKYGALILRKDSPEPILVELCPCDSLDMLVYSNTMKEAEEYADETYSINNSKIYNLIWKPLEKEIPLYSKVYVSGCGSTFYINLPALSNGDKRINELYEIYNVTSTSLIGDCRGDNHSYQSAVIFGGINYDTSMDVMALESTKYPHSEEPENYAMLRGENERGSWGRLKYSLEEVDNVEKYLSANNILVTKYTQSEASEEAFKALSDSSSDIVHVSTHGYYYQPYIHNFLTNYSNLFFSKENNNRQKFNGLLFSGANNAWRNNKYQDNVEDGILTSEEISSLNLSNTDLLVLSACQTGLGETNDIDGNEGLIRAFKVAGVNKILMTLWNVSDDATSFFMQQFYKKLLETNNPRNALNNTIKEVQKEMPDPYYWAGFILLY